MKALTRTGSLLYSYVVDEAVKIFRIRVQLVFRIIIMPILVNLWTSEFKQNVLRLFLSYTGTSRNNIGTGKCIALRINSYKGIKHKELYRSDGLLALERHKQSTSLAVTAPTDCSTTGLVWTDDTIVLL